MYPYIYIVSDYRNRIGYDKCVALARLLRKSPSIMHLDLGGDVGMPGDLSEELGDAIASMPCTKMMSLHLPRGGAFPWTKILSHVCDLCILQCA